MKLIPNASAPANELLGDGIERDNQNTHWAAGVQKQYCLLHTKRLRRQELKRCNHEPIMNPVRKVDLKPITAQIIYAPNGLIVEANCQWQNAWSKGLNNAIHLIAKVADIKTI